MLFKKLLTIFLLILTAISISPKPSEAADKCTTFSTNPPFESWTTATDPNSISIRIGGGLVPGKPYNLFQTRQGTSNGLLGWGTANAENVVEAFSWTDYSGGSDERKYLVKAGQHELELRTRGAGAGDTLICNYTYTVKDFESLKCSLIAWRNKPINAPATSYGPGENVYIEGTIWWVDVNGIQRRQEMDIDLRLWDKNNAEKQQTDSTTDNLGNFKGNLLTIPFVNPSDVGWWKISASKNNPSDAEKQLCTDPIYVTQTSGQPTTGSPPAEAPPLGAGKNPCADKYGNPTPCCTALGCIPTDPTKFTERILAIAIGLAGGIALIIMVVGAIKVLTSSGDMQKVAGGRDMIVAALAGLLFLIFSVLILRFIGGNLLPPGGPF